MLTVYTYKTKCPSGSIDLSTTPLSELADAALSILAHQKQATIWFGYIDGWMLLPQEETLLRKVIRTFSCGLISAFPLSLSQSWKNEIDCIYTTQLN